MLKAFDDMYYLKYMPKNDETKEIQNVKRIVEYSKDYLKSNFKISLLFINAIHKILLDSVRGNEKESGMSRNTVSTLIDQLVEIKILEEDFTYPKLGYKYKKIYNVFVGKKII